MGDEYGHTRKGNNNPYVQDNEINWFLWEQRDSELFAFTKKLIAIRKKYSIFRKPQFFKDSEVNWHNNWDSSTRFVAYTLIDKFFIAFNAHFQSIKLSLPPGKWTPLVQTAPAQDFSELPPYASILLEKIE
jgi:isoamylase/glycogen operon protein